MSKEKKTKFWEMKMSANKEKSADIYIYGEITKYAWEEFGEVSSMTFKKDLDALTDVDTIHLYINSPGGSVFETMAIIAMLQRHPAKIVSHIDALAASCASVLPMISNEIRMSANSLMMIHNAWTFATGNAEQIRRAADDIERINQAMIQFYLDRAGDKLDKDTLKALLDAETWLTASEAMKYGLCDVVEEANQVAASISQEVFGNYKNVPQVLMVAEPTTITAQEMKERQNIADEAKAGADYIRTILGGITK